MTETSVVRQSIALEPQDVQAVKALAKEKGLGAHGFSAAVRMIIREWQQQTNRTTQAERQTAQPTLNQ